MARDPQDVIAWGNILGQHQKSPRVEGFVRAFYPPMTAAATALDRLGTALDIDTAEGPQLDLIGSIVGIGRSLPGGTYLAFFGFQGQAAGRAFGVARMRRDGEAIATAYTAPDEEYRALIIAKIALNNGHGTAPEIAAALARVFRVSSVSIRDVGVANFEAWIPRIPLPDEQTGAIIDSIIPRAAGVKFSLVYYTPEFFGFVGQPGATGFNLAPMARGSGSNIYSV